MNLSSLLPVGSLAVRVNAAPASHAAGIAHPTDRVGTRDGESLFVQDRGIGQPVVFIHGWSMASTFWKYQTEALFVRGLRCIAYDQRGCGQSSRAESGYDFDTLADDLDAVLRARDLKNVMLVAHSMGSGEVARYLARYGTSRIAKVALVSCTTPNLEGAAWVEPLEQAMRADRPRYVREMAVPFFAPTQTSDEMVDWGINIVLQASLTASIGYNRCNLTTDLTDDMKAFTVPTLIVHGSGDLSASFEKTGARTAAMISGSRLVVYEDGGHGLPLTHAARLNEDLVRFVFS
jgi:pimeloyl-ACP methyl ester carboxylesterase